MQVYLRNSATKWFPAL